MNNLPEHVQPPLSVVNTLPPRDHSKQAQYLARWHRPSLSRDLRKKLSNAWQFVQSVLSLITKRRLSTTEYEMRLEACLGCPQLEKGPPLGHCKACGCGKRKMAELTIKANMPGAKCPLGKWDGKRT